MTSRENSATVPRDISATHKPNTIMKTSTNIIIFQDSKSPYWICQYTGPDGIRRKKSTKVPVQGGIFQGEKLSKAQARNRAQFIAHSIALQTDTDHAKHNNMPTTELFATMLNGKLGRVSQRTYNNAKTAYDIFTLWLGHRAALPLREITKADIKSWVTHRRSQVRGSTCRKDLSAIRAAFEWAVDSEIIERNPCDKVSIPPDSKDEKIIHEAFTLAEIQLLIAKLPDEWASAVLCCLGTYGQRLSDILSLRWNQFDFESRTVTIITGKTARPLCQPMQEWFYNWALATRQQNPNADFLHPRLHNHTNPSPEFTQLVRSHGIGIAGSKLGGRRRAWHSKTFHSLRASVATMLQTAGISQGMAMQLVGHDSADVHAVYIRPTAEQLRTVAASIPPILPG
ncbi:MAG: site-specific integrase [Akkermansiaceae bacterium]|nr:site-specific integrase [Akkermansiaceae bacterium]